MKLILLRYCIVDLQVFLWGIRQQNFIKCLLKIRKDIIKKILNF